MAFDLSSGFGAGAGANMLQEILKQKAQEAFQNQSLALAQQEFQSRAAYQQEALKSLQEERAANEAARQTTQAGLAAHQLTPQTAYDPSNPAIKLISANPVYAGTLSPDQTLPSANITGSADTSGGPLKITGLAETPNPAKATGQVRFAGLPDQLATQNAQAALDRIRQTNPQIADALELEPDPTKRASAVADYVKALSAPPKATPQTEGELDTQWQTNRVNELVKTGMPLEQAQQQAYRERKLMVPGFNVSVNQPKVADARTDKSYEYNQNILDKLRQPVVQQANKVDDLYTDMNQQTPVADSVLAPKFLSVIVGGQGTGLRMTQPEINNVLHGAGAWQQLKGALQRWDVDPQNATPITAAQRQQMRQLVAALQVKGRRQLAALDQADNAMLDATTVQDHRRIVNTARQALEPEGATTGSTKSVESPEHIAWRLTGQQGPEPK